jgi:putative phosphoesterase
MTVSKPVPKHIGILSDTHGLLRPAAIKLFQAVEAIFHAGDVGDTAILKELSLVAPIYAVRGNMDRGELFEKLPATLLKDCCGLSLYMIHDLLTLNVNPLASGVDVVISGHTHQAKVEQRKGVWYVNPGSAGPNPKRGRASVCLIEVLGDRLQPKVVPL